jgi:putative transposase
MYDYRRMTPEEREAIVEERRSRGFPLHKPPHPEQGRGWYLITAATFEHKPHFSAPNELRALERRLQEALGEAKISCAGWVVLPNHYHILIETECLKGIGPVIGPVHGRSSRYANLRDNSMGRQVWYKFTDRKIRSDRHFWASLHYIVHNPVKHGYVSHMEEWSWSCVHELIAEHGREWVDDLVSAYPLGEFGDKWDD